MRAGVPKLNIENAEERWVLYNKRSQFTNASVRYVHSFGGSKYRKETLVGVREEIVSLP